LEVIDTSKLVLILDECHTIKGSLVNLVITFLL